MSLSFGQQMYQWACELFPINRSITGEGTLKTLKYFQSILPNLKVLSYPSGAKVFDWEIPKEWLVSEAFIEDEQGNRIVDFRKNNLHLVAYSEAIDQWMPFSELDRHLFSLPELPHAIPYVTSFYKRTWGFCLTDRQREILRKSPSKKFHVQIRSEFKSGFLNIGELYLPGQSSEEILLSSYVCHPSMGNNELSGPCLAAALGKWLGERKNRFSYRILFSIETIGTIAYLSQFLDHLKKRVIAGFVLTCVGDSRDYSYLASRAGNTLADRVAQHVLDHQQPAYKKYSFLDRGSDERQYCAPGVDLPVCSVMRSKYGEYPEYHTSLDDLSLISPEGFEGSFRVYNEMIQILENNYYYRNLTVCEPQLGRRDLYPSVNSKGTFRKNDADILNTLAYADGTHDLVSLADRIGVYAGDLIDIVKLLQEKQLIAPVD